MALTLSLLTVGLVTSRVTSSVVSGQELRGATVRAAPVSASTAAAVAVSSSSSSEEDGFANNSNIAALASARDFFRKLEDNGENRGEATVSETKVDNNTSSVESFGEADSLERFREDLSSSSSSSSGGFLGASSGEEEGNLEEQDVSNKFVRNLEEDEGETLELLTDAPKNIINESVVILDDDGGAGNQSGFLSGKGVGDDDDDDDEELVFDPNSLPVEYQDWVLILVTFFCLWLFFLPCWLGGQPYMVARRISQFMQANLLLFIVVVAAIDALLITTAVGLMPDWDLAQYVHHLQTATQYVRVWGGTTVGKRDVIEEEQQ